MGLRWTFVPVYWQALEANGPVDLSRDVPAEWRALDTFIIDAHQHGLNILMQAPVMGGNAGGPPRWAGRREKGKSAPADMDAAAAFAGKLATRYAPGGVLATREGWKQSFGVRAWELDNEPDGYLTHWKDQTGDYAEFVTKVAAAIRLVDARAVIIGPGNMGGGNATPWIEAALDAQGMKGSPEFRTRGKPYSIGPSLDVVSFHVYEGMDSAFSHDPRTVEVAFSEVRRVFETWESRAAGFFYERKQDYWHTEGNFDFFGVLSQERRASWRIQFFTRAFAAGIRKIDVMDPCKAEQMAVRAYVQALPDPFPMVPANDRVRVLSGSPVVFRHRDRSPGQEGLVWILWARANTGPAQVNVPTIRDRVAVVSSQGARTLLLSSNQSVVVQLSGEVKMAPPILIIDRPTRSRD